MKIKIGNKEISNFGEPFIVGDIGANHNGDLEMAKTLIKTLKATGADCAKFQLWSKENLFSKSLYESNKELEEQLDSWAFGNDEMITLKKYCDENNIMFACTPISKENVDFLADELDVDYIKVASMDVSNHPFLKYVAEKEKPIILSTGTATLSEIDESVGIIEDAGNDKLVLLHCSSLYPPVDKEINLLNIDTLMGLYGYPVGYSDHTLGTAVSIAAVARGACSIEKHFTLDKKAEGWDHKISADFKDMIDIVLESKRICKAMGHSRRIPSQREIQQRLIFRRSLFAKRDISKGESFWEGNTVFKRPGSGIEPKFLNLILNKKSKSDIKKDEFIRWSDIEL
jgi:N-acetylneuraminate synthase